jgi:hypothetical protein
MPYTGGLLLGGGLIPDMYVHMGFPKAYRFFGVYELIFENGELQHAANRSQEMAEVREALAGKSLGPKDSTDLAEVKRWVQQCFNLEY